MKLSTRARYGLRAMVELARHEDGITGRNIAENQKLPAAYLEQLMSRLRHAGLVTATRGARGRFMLARKADTISLAEIIEVLEGTIELASCDEITHCAGSPERCALRQFYQGVNQALFEHLSNISLEKLMQDHFRQLDALGEDFSI
jgi:Rrf2 family protein